MFGGPYSSERVCALAGVAGCCILVDEFAVSGRADLESVQFFTNAFLDTDPNNSPSILKPQNALVPGLQLLRDMIGNNSNELSRRRLSYTLQTIQLMPQFLSRKDLLKMLEDEIPIIAEYASLDDRLLAMGALYERSVSTLSYRIQIHSSQNYVQQPELAQKIRALLFCAIRFALLWRQNGGSKFDFLIRKNHICSLAQGILNTTLN